MPNLKLRIRALFAAVGLVATCTGCSGQKAAAPALPSSSALGFGNASDATEMTVAMVMSVAAPPSEELLLELLDGDKAPTSAVLERFATDAPPPIHDAFFEDLPSLVERLPLFERKRVLSRWSTDQSPDLRAAAGRALQSSFVAFGAGDVVRSLASDPDESVRKHGQLAAMIRRVPLGLPRALAFDTVDA